MSCTISDLIDKQRLLQIKGKTGRFNTLDEYSSFLGFGSISYSINEDAFFELIGLEKPVRTEQEVTAIQVKKDENREWRLKDIKKLL